MSDNELSKIREVLSDLQKSLAVAGEREKSIRDALDRQSDEIKELKNEISQMHAMANRWKGGFIVLAGLGGVVGWFLSSWSNVLGLFR